MAENVHTKLFSEFAPNTTQEWMDKVTADLKGADFNKKLVWRTNEGFNGPTDVSFGEYEGPQVLGLLPRRISLRER